MNRIRVLTLGPTTVAVVCSLLALLWLTVPVTAELSNTDVPAEVRQLLDAPLLFTKRHSYSGIHIYDTYYKWPPGGGGIYIVENPWAPRAEWRIRPIIDPTTEETLGEGVYTDPELSYDAKRILFCFKGEPSGSTSIYEIGVDGRGLRRLTDPTPTCDDYKGSHAGQHDVCPAYLPDGRIVFLSTRPSGLVPCNNTGVAILHVMNADGSDIHTISVNNVNEFDPVVLPDGRLLFGRWEYVDKNALTIQSLWTMNPDGTQETAFFANNMVFPEAILDVRPVPNSHLVVGTLSKHNSTPRGSIAFIDTHRGKNGPQAIINLEHPDDPTYDRGDSCEPWPLSENVVLASGRPPGFERNVIQMLDRSGNRVVLLSDPDICLHSPMLVKPRAVPRVIPDVTDPKARTGRFFVQDIYQGLTGVRRGEVKWLRVLEETSRTSQRSGGANPYNQTFLVSSALAFSVKNFLGVVPVSEDGSAYFEVPSGRAIYLQALDADGRLVQSMRTFVQAAPGVTRSCIGCHEDKQSTTAATASVAGMLGREPDQLQPESWGDGLLDYPSMVQPILDRRCVRCHGGEDGIAGGMDLSGGWTEHFSISYENLTARRETQLIAYWIAGIDCMNGTAFWSAQRFPPRGHGSGAAPLAELLVSGHDGYIQDLTREERDLLMAWIDTNGVYHGNYDTTANGCAIVSWARTRDALISEMRNAGCFRCHADKGRLVYFEHDWFNLQKPEWSRILRAPLAKGGEGMGLELCRERPVNPRRQRIRLLWKGYAHAVQPLEAFAKQPFMPPDPSGQPVVSFASTSDPAYRRMLEIIRQGRAEALASPRSDMPGAEILVGECRQFVELPPPVLAPQPTASVDGDGVVQLTWHCSADLVGREVELHRSSEKEFEPEASTLLARTRLTTYSDVTAPEGVQYYALVVPSPGGTSVPAYASVVVPPPVAPLAPEGLEILPASCSLRLHWQGPTDGWSAYHVYRRAVGSSKWTRLTERPLRQARYFDTDVVVGETYAYAVKAISRRGIESDFSSSVEATATVINDPVFVADLQEDTRGRLLDNTPLEGQLHGKAIIGEGALDLRQGGYLTFAHRADFELNQPLSIECWLWLDQPGKIPVVVGCGYWKRAGWFLQKLGNTWRWHVGGIDCDGGRPPLGRWVHVVGTYDGQTARLFEDGKLVAEKTGEAVREVWPGPLHVGQYSQPGPDFQVYGRMRGLKVYHRPIDAAEAAELASRGPE